MYSVHTFHGRCLTGGHTAYCVAVMLAQEWSKYLCMNLKVHKDGAPVAIVGPCGIVREIGKE